MNRRTPQPARSLPSVALTPADHVDIIECFPAPRVQLLVVLRVAAESNPVAVALAVASFVSALQAADHKLRLTLNPLRSVAGEGEVTLVFTPARLGVEAARRLDEVVRRAPEAVAAFAEVTLARVEVVPQL